jgi:hypothetical protein
MPSLQFLWPQARTVGYDSAQGYSAAMLVEESRLLEVTTFGTLHLYQDELDQNQVLPDVLTIVDEADRQLTETIRGFMGGSSGRSLAAFSRSDLWRKDTSHPSRQS